MDQKHNANRSLPWPRLFVVATTFVALAVGGCAPQADVAAVGADAAVEADVAAEADEAAVRTVFDEATAALNVGDGSVVDLDTEDVVIMHEGGPAVIGKEANRTVGEEFREQTMFEEVRSIDEVVVSGDWGFVRWNGMGTITAKDGGEPTEFNRKGISILQRQADNSWKIARVIWNSNLPVATLTE